MDATGFLKTAKVGGFDKKDVLSCIDSLNSKIHNLELELEEKKELLRKSGDNSADKDLVAELQVNIDSLRNQINDNKDIITNKNTEIEQLKSRNSALEKELKEAKHKISSVNLDEDGALEIGNVFLEAQKTANSIITRAKENAQKIDSESKIKADRLIEEAEDKASGIIRTAESKAQNILEGAEDKSVEMRTAATKIKGIIAGDISVIAADVSKLAEILQLFTDESLTKLSETKAVIDKTLEALNKGNVPPVKSTARPIHKQASPSNEADESKEEEYISHYVQETPEPVKARVSEKSSGSSRFKFDMSELESLTKAAEAAVSGTGHSEESELSGIEFSEM